MMILEAILIFACIFAQQQAAYMQPVMKRNPVINLTKSTLVSDILKSLSAKCNITYGPDILALCERSVHKPTDLSYFDYEQAICMTLYESVQRICNQTNLEKIHLKKSDEKVENVSALCNEMRSALNVSSSDPSEDFKWANLLKEKLNKTDDTTCKRTCIEGLVVNPVCSAVMQANGYLKKKEKSNVHLKKVDVPVTPIVSPEQQGNAGELADLPQQNRGADIPAKSQQQGNVESSARQEDVISNENAKPSDVSYPENPSRVPIDTTEDRFIETQQGSNVYPGGFSGVPFITDEEFQLKQQTGKNQENHDYPSSPSEPTKDVVLKTPNSDKNETIKTHDGKTNSKIEKVQVTKTHEENTQSEIPDKKPLVLRKEKPKSSEHKPSEGKQTQPSQTIKSEVDNKEADPQVSSQGEPPKINPKVSLPNPVNTESEKTDHAEDSAKENEKTDHAEDSAKENVDVKEENTAAEPPPEQNSDPNMMSTSNNAIDNGSLEDEGLLSSDPELGGDLETGNIDLKYPQNENSPKKESLNEDDDDVEISPNEAVIPGQKFVNAEDSHFFAYFMTMVVLCIIGYLVFHNKQKILALALEGRSRRSTRRRPNTSGYRKLDSNLEEAVTSACSTSVTHVIY